MHELANSEKSEKETILLHEPCRPWYRMYREIICCKSVEILDILYFGRIWMTTDCLYVNRGKISQPLRAMGEFHVEALYVKKIESDESYG